MLGDGNLPEQKQTYHKGAQYDLSPEKVFNSPENGFFVDGHNVQSTSNDGNTGDVEKIKGEEIVYEAPQGLSGYTCMASDTVNGAIVELWAPSSTSQPSIVRVDGVVVLSSTLLDLRPGYPLQWDTNNSSLNGEITITDKRVAPFVFNIKDMVDNVSTQKYFSAFDPKLYQVNIQSALDSMVFIDLINVGGGGGLPVGKYQYQLRYSSQSGDRTQWSHPTPLIPVVESLSSSSAQYPWSKTRGGPPAPTSVTSFAPKLRFRVTNLYDYDYIEIKRIPYNQGAGIDYTSNGYIVARIDVSPGEISVREYIDPQESNINIPLSSQDETRELAHIESAGSVRYYDKRLTFSNITVASKEANLTFLAINGKKGFPVLDKLFKSGYNDPYNMVYRASEMRGETVGYGVNLYDCVGNKGFASKIPELKNFTFPNRRDPVSSETGTYSFGGTPMAALASDTNSVGHCHEVFDMADSIPKGNYYDFKNVVEKGRVIGATGTKVTEPYGVRQDCNETNGEIENHGANVSPFGSSVALVSTSYQPFTPVNQNDSDVEGHNYVVNTKVATHNIKTGPRPIEDDSVYVNRPRGFAPDYYAMGMMISGVDNFPTWAKAFSVVKTERADRVVCQGLAYYSLTKARFKVVGNDSLGGKHTDRFWFYAPDIENGIVSSDTLNDIISNPQNYKLQFVSPLGFFSEYYSGEDNLIDGQRDRCIDMISYVRMLRDVQEKGSNQMNPGEDVDMGIDGLDGYSYVAYDKYRNQTIIPNTFTGNPDGGNRLFGINQVNRISEGRGNYLELISDSSVYATASTGGNPQFEDNGTKNLTEPIYVVNIIRTGASVPDTDLQKYRQTTHYQKIESIIGKSTGVANQKFILVDERWEDCIPAPNAGISTASTDRFVYVKLENGTVQKWINVTYKTQSQRALIIANINANIGDYSGVYTHTNIDNLNRFYELNFNVSGFYPPANSLILVRYDNTAPIRVYGGDTFIGETIFAPIDRESSARDDAGESQFAFGVGLPYKMFKINPRYYTIRKSGAAANAIQDKEWFTLGYIRQLCVMFTVESKSAIHLAHNMEYPKQAFPKMHYVIRPNRWDQDKSIVDNHLFEDYAVDYGEAEKEQWKWGGFRFLQQINPDYSVMPPIAFFSKPSIGFVERRVFPTRTMWSLPRSINVQNSPSIKTFPANNSFDSYDGCGEIKRLWLAQTEKGENLYAITESGVHILLTKKDTLSNQGGGNLGYMSSDSFITDDYWLSYSIGIPDKMWRAAAEADIPITGEDGSEITRQAFFFINNESVYRLMDNSIIDIGRIGYHSKIYKDGLALIGPGMETKLSSVFDKYKKQFYFNISDESINKTFVFSQKNNMWFGTSDVSFDKFTTNGNDTYGHRDFKTYKLNSGYILNGNPITCRLLAAFSPQSEKDKEFASIRVNSSKKPTELRYYKEKNGVVQYTSNQANNGPLYLKNYRGWKAEISRVSAAVDAKRPRMQGRLLLVEIINNLAEEFTVVDVTVEYKTLM